MDQHALRRDAKRLLRGVGAGEPAAQARAAAVLGERWRERFVLADALHVIAVEHGRRSWPAFKHELEQAKATWLPRVLVSVPLTGRLSDAGQDALEAAWLAVADTGSKISLVAADEGADREYEDRAVENARRAIADATVLAYLGDFRSGASTASLPLLERAGLAQVSFSNTYRNLTGSSYFNVIANDDRVAEGLAGWMVESGVRRPFLIESGEYGTDFRWLVHRALAARGVPVLGAARRLGPHHVPDVDPEADAIFFGAVAQQLPAPAVTALAAQAPGALLFAPDGMAWPELARDLPGDVAARMRMVQGAAPAAALSPAAVAVERRLAAQLGRAPDVHAIYAYEATALLASVLGWLRDRREVILRLKMAERPDSVLGPYRFRPDGSTTLATTGRLVIDGGEIVAVPPAG